MTAPNAVLTAAQMREAEQRAVAGGTSEDELMRRAGTGAAEWVWRLAAGRPVTILCGPGNNGGDGYVIAQVLHERGLDVAVIAPSAPATDVASRARAAYSGPVGTLPAGGVFVDCLFGTGLKGELAQALVSVQANLLDSHDLSIAIDLPSGIESDCGEDLRGPLPSFDLTLALGAWKPAHWLLPASKSMGARRLVDIGINPQFVAGFVSAKPILTSPAAAAHKYTRGLVAVVAGEMEGAALLSSMAAMRGGAGYVKMLAERGHAVPPPDLVVDRAPLSEALEDHRIAACLAGPGLGRSAAARERLRTVIATPCPLVLDADALFLLNAGDLNARGASVLLTPHAGEMATLCSTFGIVAIGKVDQARELARACNAVVLAKGADTILTDGDRVRFFPPASSWLSAAGTGDVLAGLAVSRLAVTGDGFRAAEEAFWLHASAADRCGSAFTATDLIGNLSDAYGDFR